jgi:hypothetical protein
MMRQEGWEHLLAEHIDSAFFVPFSWGKIDCALWVSEWVRKATGVDHAQAWLGQYANGTQAKRLIRARGYGKSVAGIPDKHLQTVSISEAARGDLALHPRDDALGIVTGARAFFLAKRGLVHAPVAECRKAWRV